MKTITTLTFALLASAGLTLAGCQKRDDMPATGAGRDTPTTTPLPGGTTTAPADTNTGTPGSMSTSPAMPPASSASR